MTVDIAELRKLLEKAANDTPDDRAISERQLLNALPALLDEIEALRRVRDAAVADRAADDPTVPRSVVKAVRRKLYAALAAAEEGK